MRLLDLNYDVLHHLMSLPDTQCALPHAVLTCRTLYELAMPILVSKVQLSGMNSLFQLAKFLSHKRVYASRVQILELSFSYDDLNDPATEFEDCICTVISACNNIQSIDIEQAEMFLDKCPRVADVFNGLSRLATLRLKQSDYFSEDNLTSLPLLSGTRAPLREIELVRVDYSPTSTSLWDALGHFSDTLESLSLELGDLRGYTCTTVTFPHVHTLKLENIDVLTTDLQRIFPHVHTFHTVYHASAREMLEQNQIHECDAWEELLELHGSPDSLASLGLRRCRVQYLACSSLAIGKLSLLPGLLLNLRPLALKLSLFKRGSFSVIPCTTDLVAVEIGFQPMTQKAVDYHIEFVRDLPGALVILGTPRFLRLDTYLKDAPLPLMALNAATASSYADQIFCAVPSLRLVDLRWELGAMGRRLFVNERYGVRRSGDIEGVRAPMGLRADYIAQLSLQEILKLRSEQSAAWLFKND